MPNTNQGSKRSHSPERSGQQSAEPPEKRPRILDIDRRSRTEPNAPETNVIRRDSSPSTSMQPGERPHTIQPDRPQTSTDVQASSNTSNQQQTEMRTSSSDTATKQMSREQLIATQLHSTADPRTIATALETYHSQHPEQMPDLLFAIAALARSGDSSTRMATRWVFQDAFQQWEYPKRNQAFSTMGEIPHNPNDVATLLDITNNEQTTTFVLDTYPREHMPALLSAIADLSRSGNSITREGTRKLFKHAFDRLANENAGVVFFSNDVLPHNASDVATLLDITQHPLTIATVLNSYPHERMPALLSAIADLSRSYDVTTYVTMRETPQRLFQGAFQSWETLKQGPIFSSSEVLPHNPNDVTTLLDIINDAQTTTFVLDTYPRERMPALLSAIADRPGLTENPGHFQNALHLWATTHNNEALNSIKAMPDGAKAAIILDHVPDQNVTVQLLDHYHKNHPDRLSAFLTHRVNRSANDREYREHFQAALYAWADEHDDKLLHFMESIPDEKGVAAFLYIIDKPKITASALDTHIASSFLSIIVDLSFKYPDIRRHFQQPVSEWATTHNDDVLNFIKTMPYEPHVALVLDLARNQEATDFSLDHYHNNHPKKMPLLLSAIGFESTIDATAQEHFRASLQKWASTHQDTVLHTIQAMPYTTPVALILDLADNQTVTEAYLESRQEPLATILGGFKNAQPDSHITNHFRQTLTTWTEARAQKESIKQNKDITPAHIVSSLIKTERLYDGIDQLLEIMYDQSTTEGLAKTGEVLIHLPMHQIGPFLRHANRSAVSGNILLHSQTELTKKFLNGITPGSHDITQAIVQSIHQQGTDVVSITPQALDILRCIYHMDVHNARPFTAQLDAIAQAHPQDTNIQTSIQHIYRALPPEAFDAVIRNHLPEASPIASLVQQAERIYRYVLAYPGDTLEDLFKSYSIQKLRTIPAKALQQEQTEKIREHIDTLNATEGQTIREKMYSTRVNIYATITGRSGYLLSGITEQQMNIEHASIAEQNCMGRIKLLERLIPPNDLDTPVADTIQRLQDTVAENREWDIWEATITNGFRDLCQQKERALVNLTTHLTDSSTMQDSAQKVEKIQNIAIELAKLEEQYRQTTLLRFHFWDSDPEIIFPEHDSLDDTQRGQKFFNEYGRLHPEVINQSLFTTIFTMLQNTYISVDPQASTIDRAHQKEASIGAYMRNNTATNKKTVMSQYSWSIYNADEKHWRNEADSLWDQLHSAAAQVGINDLQAVLQAVEDKNSREE